jgi:hypothetical protein
MKKSDQSKHEKPQSKLTDNSTVQKCDKENLLTIQVEEKL